MSSKLKKFLSWAQPGLLLSIFAIGFGITLLSLAVLVSNASASESYCRECQTK